MKATTQILGRLTKTWHLHSGMSLQAYCSLPSVRSQMSRNQCKWSSCPKHVDRMSNPHGNKRESSFSLQEKRFLGPGSVGTLGRRAAPWRRTRWGYDARFASVGRRRKQESEVLWLQPLSAKPLRLSLSSAPSFPSSGLSVPHSCIRNSKRQKKWKQSFGALQE